MYCFIDFLKTIAALLITNSHYNNIWPIATLATGGAIGNALFFLVSGFCLSNTNVSFKEWYKKRLLRIYPQTWIISVIALIIGVFKICDIKDILYVFIFPTGFWFVGVIAFYYISAYFIEKYVPMQFYKFIYLFIFVSYLLYYLLILDKTKWSIENDFKCKFIFYFTFIVIGIQLKKIFKNKKDKVNINKIFYSLMVIISLGLFYGFKIMCYCNIVPMQLQGIQHIFLIFLALSMFLLSYSFEKKFNYLSQNMLWKPIKGISRITLEIYLVQVPILEYSHYISFPFSLFIFTAVIFFSAKLLHESVNQLLKR